MEFSYQEKELKTAEHIREAYSERGKSDIEKLRKLDGKVKRPAEILAYTLGVIGSLVLGVGMCIAMQVVGTANLMPLGIAVGALGIIIVVANYFIYSAVLKSRKRRFSAEVIALSDKILNKSDN